MHIFGIFFLSLFLFCSLIRKPLTLTYPQQNWPGWWNCCSVCPHFRAQHSLANMVPLLALSCIAGIFYNRGMHLPQAWTLLVLSFTWGIKCRWTSYTSVNCLQINLKWSFFSLTAEPVYTTETVKGWASGYVLFTSVLFVHKVRTFYVNAIVDVGCLLIHHFNYAIDLIMFVTVSVWLVIRFTWYCCLCLFNWYLYIGRVWTIKLGFFLWTSDAWHSG